MATTTRRVTLAGTDFTEPPEPKEQAVTLIFALAGQGKSTFGLYYAPGPVAYIDMDHRGLFAVQKAKERGQKIHYLSVDYPRNLHALSAEQVIREVTKSTDMTRRNFDKACEASFKGDIRSIVGDTFTEYSELLNMKFTGHKERAKADYGKSAGKVKAELSEMIKCVRQSNANLIMLARAKEVWEGGEPTGKYTFRGPDTLDFDADWSAHIRIAKRHSIKDRGKAPKFEMEITKAGIDISVLGNVYNESDWSTLGPFVWGCMENYPGTDPTTWE